MGWRVWISIGVVVFVWACSVVVSNGMFNSVGRGTLEYLRVVGDD